jgi:GT2 family glycosyltransferase
MQHCANRLGIVITRPKLNDARNPTLVFECVALGRCVLDQAGFDAVANLPDLHICEGCPSRREPREDDVSVARPDQPPVIIAAQDAWLVCPHRGEPVGEVTAAGCGCDRTIYACPVKGRCLKKLPTARSRESFGGELWGVTVCQSECRECERKPTPLVAIIVTSHNYGRFLPDCLVSVLSQTVVPSEILVVDDASTDDTHHIALQFAEHGVSYLRVEHRNVYMTRRAGLIATSAPFVIFLDADDKIGPTYVAEGMTLLESDPTLGVATSDLMAFGTVEGPIRHQPCNLERHNWVHAGSMVRRAALSQSGAFDGPGPDRNAHEDWFIWRQVARGGWRTAKIPSTAYFYRQHPASMMHGTMRAGSYYKRAALALEPVTFVLPICRERYFDRIAKWLAQEPRITDVLVIDSSDDDAFRARLKSWAIALPVRSVKYVSRPRSEGLADADRAASVNVYRGVQQAMPQIYRHLRDVSTEYMIILEDDVHPPVGTVDQLLRGIDENVAVVSGVVPSRYQTKRAIAGTTFDSTLAIGDRQDLQDVAFTGFACACLRRSALLDVEPLHAGGVTGNYDIEFGRAVRAKGWRWILDWSVRCGHADIPMQITASVEVDFVTDRIAIGNAITSIGDATHLRRLGITHIINCRDDASDAPFVGESGIVLLDNPTPDTPAPFDQPREWFLRSVAFAKQALEQRNAKLFIHCKGGISRGPSTAYAILRTNGCLPGLAEQLIRLARPKVGLEYVPAAERALRAA